jgi:pimeloyl-ACP methyl ester carboxylesterase
MFASLAEYQQQANYHRLQEYTIATWQEASTDDNQPVLLLLHGFPSASYDWHLLWPMLAKHFAVHALDFLGFGLSQKPYPHQYSLLEQADIVVQYCRVKGIRQCHLLAHDYGVSVAQELLHRSQSDSANTPQVLTCALLNGGIYADLHRPVLLQRLLASRIGPWLTPWMRASSLARSFTRIFGPDTPPTKQLIDDLWALLAYLQGRRVIPALLGYIHERGIHATTWAQALQRQQSQLAFINGIHDPISGQHMLDAFETQCPDAYSKALKVGHYPQIEAPNEVYSALCEFWELPNQVWHPQNVKSA